MIKYVLWTPGFNKMINLQKITNLGEGGGGGTFLLFQVFENMESPTAAKKNIGNSLQYNEIIKMCADCTGRNVSHLY